MVITFARSCRSVARSVRYLFAPCPFKNSLWRESRALFASKAPSAKTLVCITPTILRISHAICYFRCVFNALHTLFLLNLPLFWKIWSPASVGRIILKVASPVTPQLSCSRRFCIACFLSPVCSSVPKQKLKGGGVALPRGPSIISET